MNFGKNLRLWRERLGLSLADVSDASGLALSTISQIETGKQRPHNTSKKVIAEAIGKTVEELLSPPPPVQEFRTRRDGPVSNEDLDALQNELQAVEDELRELALRRRARELKGLLSSGSELNKKTS